MKAQRQLDQRRNHRSTEEGIHQPGRQRRQPHGPRHLCDEPSPHGHPLGIVPVLLPLSLEPGHVDVGGALALAGLAGEAEVEHLGEFWTAPGIGRARIREGRPEHVGPRPRGVLLVAGGHVAGAHRAAGLRWLAALANPRAPLGRSQHAAGVGEAKDGVVVWLGLTRQDPQGGVHRRSVDDLVGIEDPLWIKEPFDLLKMVVAGIAHHHAEKLTAEPAVAMLAAEAAAILLHKCGNVGGD